VKLSQITYTVLVETLNLAQSVCLLVFCLARICEL